VDALVVTGSRLIICSVFSITEADNLVNIIKKEDFRCYKKLVYLNPLMDIPDPTAIR
jgi:hypothetical protein